MRSSEWSYCTPRSASGLGMTVSVQANDALIVIDVQNDFCAGGALAVPDGDAVVTPINRLMAQFPVVVLTQDWHPRGHTSFASEHEGARPFDTIDVAYGAQTLWPDHCVQGTHGGEFHPDLDVERAQLIVRKGFRKAVDSYSAFVENDRQTSTGLDHWLRGLGVDRVVCCGLALDYCVRYSAEDARARGFDTAVVESACRGIDLDGSNDAARQALRTAGVQLI